MSTAKASGSVRYGGSLKNGGLVSAIAAVQGAPPSIEKVNEIRRIFKEVRRFKTSPQTDGFLRIIIEESLKVGDYGCATEAAGCLAEDAARARLGEAIGEEIRRAMDSAGFAFS